MVMKNQEKITAQDKKKKNKRHWIFGAVLVAIGILILSTACIALILFLTNKKAKTEVVTKTKIQHQIVESKSDSDLKTETTRLQDELKNNVVQGGQERANLDATENKQAELEITRLQNELKKTELDSVLANIDSLNKQGGQRSVDSIIRNSWRIWFEDLTNFVNDKSKRQLLVNSGQTSEDQKEKDFYQFVPWLNQAIDLKEKKDEQTYDLLLEEVENKFGTQFQKVFNFYVSKKGIWSKIKSEKTYLRMMLKHILSTKKIKESDIK